MPSSTITASARTALVATTFALLAPAAASAASITVTGDAGSPVPVPAGAPPTIRNMRPEVGVAFPPGDGRYRLTVTNATGAAVSSGADCFSHNVLGPYSVNYSGNGAYTVTVTNFGANDTKCATPTSTETYGFTIAASTSITPPAGPFLLREFGSFVTNPLQLPIALNPGATDHEVRFAANATLGPDGAIAGSSAQAFVDSTTGMARANVPGPGVYTFVARPTRAGSAGTVPGPWSAPVQVIVRAPFDFKPGIDFLDQRGPSYKVRATLREASARGKVRVALARGSKGGKFRSLGSATISSKGTITKRLRATRPGSYRLRFSYKGSQTIAAGSGTIGIRVTRVFG